MASEQEKHRALVLREYEEKTARGRKWLMALEGNTARGGAHPVASLLEQKVHPY